MTCIIACKTKDKIYMGTDSAVTFGTDESAISFTQTEPVKVFKRGGLLFSTSASLRFGQILRDNFDFPPLTAADDIVRYLTTEFVDKLIETLDRLKYLEMRDGEARGYAFLVGAHGRIFRICIDFAVLEIDEPFIAIGAGEAYAMGALAALNQVVLSGWEPKDKILHALEITARYCPSVRGPFTIIES